MAPANSGVGHIWLPDLVGVSRLATVGGARALSRRVLHEVMQVRLPFALAVLLGRFHFAYCWLFVLAQFARALFSIFRTRRAGTSPALGDCSAKGESGDSGNTPATRTGGLKQERLGKENKAVKPDDRDKCLLLMSVAGELYLHLFAGLLFAFEFGYYKWDLLLLLPIVEVVIAMERLFPTIHRRCRDQLRNRPEARYASNISDEQKEIFFETLCVQPIDVQDEWFNLLLAQFWHVYANGWVSGYVRCWVEQFTAKLGLVTEEIAFGQIPAQIRQINGKRRRQEPSLLDDRNDRPEDWTYDLDLHVEFDLAPMIRLIYPLPGFKFPIFVDRLRVSGAFRVELEFLELNHYDSRAANPMFPNLAGLRIGFIERPDIDLSLWIGGLFDLVSIPVIRWIIQKFVVDNILCYKLKLGPSCDGADLMDLFFPKKTLLCKERDRKRHAEADLDTQLQGMSCQVLVKVAWAQNLPFGCHAFCILKYGSGSETLHADVLDEGTSRTRAHPGPDYIWDEDEDKPFKWVTKSDTDVIRLWLMDRHHNIVGRDTKLGEFTTTVGDLRRDLDLRVNQKAKFKICKVGDDETMEVHLEVQLKNVSDLPGIHVPSGTSLEEAQGIPAMIGDDGVRHFESELPLQRVGGLLRVRLFRVDNLIPKFRDPKILVRVICGKETSYGPKLHPLHGRSETTPVAQQHYTNHMTKSQAKKLEIQAEDSIPVSSGPASGLYREWKEVNGSFEIGISEDAASNVLSLQVWRANNFKIVGSAQGFLGSVCICLAHLKAHHNGALFKQAVFKAPIYDNDGLLVDHDNEPSTVNFIAEFVPEFAFA